MSRLNGKCLRLNRGRGVCERELAVWGVWHAGSAKRFAPTMKSFVGPGAEKERKETITGEGDERSSKSPGGCSGIHGLMEFGGGKAFSLEEGQGGRGGKLPEDRSSERRKGGKGVQPLQKAYPRSLEKSFDW